MPMTIAAKPPISAWLPTAALWEAEAEAEAADLEALTLALRDADAEAAADPVMEAISEDAALRREERRRLMEVGGADTGGSVRSPSAPECRHAFLPLLHL